MIIDTNCTLYAKMHKGPPSPICAKVNVNRGSGAGAGVLPPEDFEFGECGECDFLYSGGSWEWAIP